MSWIKKGDPPRRHKLSASQKAALPEICEKWNKVVFNTAPADRERAERSVVQFYKDAGLLPPTEMVWHKSPMKAMEERPMARWYAIYDDSDWARQIDGGVMPGQGWVKRWYETEVFNSNWNIVRSSVINFWSPGRILMGANVKIPRGQIPPNTEGNVYDIGYGLDRAQECAFVDFFSNVVGIEYQWPSLLEAIASCGYMWLGKSKVVFFERPSTVRLDDQRRPHCLDSPAVEYRDGYKFYAIHGIPVPGKYIETAAEQIDLAELLQEQNAEVRMAVISKVGFKRILEMVQPKNEIKETCPHCGERFLVVVPGRSIKGKRFTANIARVLSRSNGNALIELTIGRIPRDQSNWDRINRGPDTDRIRLLHLTWRDKTGEKETIISVPRTKRQFGRDCPENVDNCEQVRRWTLGWSKDIEIVAET